MASSIAVADVSSRTSNDPKPPSFFKRYTTEIGAISGIFIGALIWFMPRPAALPVNGQHCLALSLFAVVWWAFSVVNPGYTSLMLLVGYVLTKTAPAPVVFSLFTNQLMYLVVGGYLIAAAVEGSGLGHRIAYFFTLKFVSSYSRIIAACYILGFALSIMIPQPWPRSFMIMSVMAVIIKSAKLEPKYAVQVGLTAFASSCPTSMILLTGDSTLNVVAMSFGGMQSSWMKWLLYMGVPGVVTSILIFLLQIWLFPGPKDLTIDKTEIQGLLTKLGPVSRNEKATIFWVVTAVALWMTDWLHHVEPGWIAIGAALLMTLPRIGAGLAASAWSKVPLGNLYFLTAALGIGTVGTVTGMNTWVASVVLPSHAPANIFLFALVVTVFAVGIHMVLGSVLAVMSIVTPAILLFSHGSAFPPIAASLLVYTACNQQYLLPFQNMAILVGQGEQGGGYSSKEVFRLGLPLTAVVFIITVCVEVPWWKFIGLIK